MKALKIIGQQLDNNIFPSVGNGGIVMPNTTPVQPTNLGMENKYGEQTSRRSENWQRTRAPRWQRQTRRPWRWQTSETTPIVSTTIRALYEKEINSVKNAYPGAKVWVQDEGMWLLTESSILDECWHSAFFFTGISFLYPFNVRSWGFWSGGFLQKPVWIGPRHTNFPDGSVCAFEPSDYTWSIGQPIVTLLDLYTLWALRHLHLEFIGRWPGPQAVHHPYERIIELKVGELCGCGQSGKRYGECCHEKDLARDRVADAVNFRFITGGKPRTPPSSVVEFISSDQGVPPRICELV